MLNQFTICFTVALLLLSTLLPVQAEQPSGCPGIQIADDVCYAPGTSASPRFSAKKTCITCVLPPAIADAIRPNGHASLHLAKDDRTAPNRVVPPDRRPPRT